MGEIFYRIAAKSAIKPILKHLDPIWNNIQLGINVSGGCINAFNSIDRSKVLAALYAKPQLAPLWPIVNFAYSEPSLLLTRDANGFLSKSLLSSQGCVKVIPWLHFSLHWPSSL